MASRASALEDYAEEGETEESSSTGVPQRRRARPPEKTVICLGKTAGGTRCSRARQALFCDEHEWQWTYLTEPLKTALKDVAESNDALKASVWDHQYKVVQEYLGTLEHAESVKVMVNVAEAGAGAVLEARSDLQEVMRDGAARITGML
jgi:hypothetical protein